MTQTIILCSISKQAAASCSTLRMRALAIPFQPGLGAWARALHTVSSGLPLRTRCLSQSAHGDHLLHVGSQIPGSALFLPSSCIQLKQQWLWPSSLVPVAGFAKKAGKKGGKRAAAEEEDSDAEEEEEEFTLEPFERQMESAVSHLQTALGKIHTGRASPGLLEPIEVQSHGERSPLCTYATVTVRNPHLLVANVYNAEDVEAVSTAIRMSPLKLQARAEGNEVLVPLPRPTMEGVQAMAKLVRQEVEKAKGSVRSVRHKALEAVKKEFRSADERQRTEREVQKLHNVFVDNVEKLRDLKNKELEASYR